MLYSQSPPLTADDAFDGLARDLGVRSEQRMPRRRPQPASDSSYSYRFGEGQPAAIARPSIGKRMFSSLFRFTITVLIGIGATLGWQSYGEEIREILIAQAPAVGMLLPVPSTRPTAASAAAYGDASRQLAPMASTLDAVRRSVEQLAVKQEQMAQNIVALRAVEDEVRQKLLPASSVIPPAPVAAPPQQASTPPAKPPQARIDPRLQPPPGSQFSR